MLSTGGPARDPQKKPGTKIKYKKRFKTMYLRDTPYITIKNSGQIDFTQAYIKEYSNPLFNYVFSYNTVIGIYTIVEGTKIYLETAGSYSTTTATKHKPRAQRIAAYNNYQIIPDIKPEILHDLLINENKYNIVDLIKEVETRKKLITELKDNNENGPTIKQLKLNGILKSYKEPVSKNYKNGNRQTKYYYKTNFKYTSNIYYELNNKAVKTTIRTNNGTATTNKYINNIVNIKY